MVNADPRFGLRGKDLTLLGSSYMTSYPLRFVHVPHRFQIGAPRMPIFGLSCHVAIASTFFAGAWWLSSRFDPFDDSVQLQIKFVFVLVGILAIFGPVIGHVWRVLHLCSISPLIEYDKRANRVTLLAGKHSFAPEEIHSILLIAAPTDESVRSELQVVVDLPEGRERILIASDISSTTKPFRKPLTKFAEQARLPLLNAELKSFWTKDSPLVVTQLVAGRE